MNAMPIRCFILLLVVLLLLPRVAHAQVAAGNDPLETTAAEVVKASLARLPADGTLKSLAVQIGTTETNEVIARENTVRPFTLTENAESYHLRAHGGVLYIVGRSPKGAMNGVFRLVNRGDVALRALDAATLDEHGSPAFRYRIGDHLRTQKAPPDWSDDRQGQWYASHFINVVWGEKFGPPLPYEVRKKWGLGLMLEASLPPTPEGTHWGDTAHKSKWWDDPANASAIYDWGRPSWYGKPKVVDPFDPVGRRAYIDNFNNLLAQNPDTKILYCIFGDYSWAPNEDSRRVSDGKKFEHTQEEAIAEIMKLAREAIGQRDVIPAVWMWLLFPRQGKEKFMEQMTADGIGVMYNEASDNDCWTYLRDNFDNVSLKLDADGKTKFGPNYIPLVSIGGTCESVRPGVGMPLPFVGASKAMRLRDAGVQNFIIWWGSCEGWSYQANIEAMSELLWNPDAFDRKTKTPYDPKNPEPMIAKITRRDFGELADGVLRFYEAFDRALVDVDLNGNRAGLQHQSWYQRTGSYLIFLNGHAQPIIPTELAQKEKLANLFPWVLRPKAAENWAVVWQNLGQAIGQLTELRTRPAPADVQERLAAMERNVRAFYLVFVNEFNHMRALQVMEANASLPLDSPVLKAKLLPIIRDDLANTEKLIQLTAAFPSNFYLSSKYEREKISTRDAEIKRLREKLAAMRAYVRSSPAQADGEPGIADGALLSYGENPRTSLLHLPRSTMLDAIALHWNGVSPTEWTLETSADGSTWSIAATAAASEPPLEVETIAFEPREVAAIRVTAAANDVVRRIEAFTPQALQSVVAEAALLRPPFAAGRSEYELVVPAGRSEVRLSLVRGPAATVFFNGRSIEGDILDVDVTGDQRPIELKVADARGTKIYTLIPKLNLAAGAIAVVSSVEGEFEAKFAIDGIDPAAGDKSRWVSRIENQSWIALDLRRKQSFSRAIVLNGHLRGSSHAMPAFELQVSDDAAVWRTIAKVEGNQKNAAELRFDPATARHVRLLVTSTPDGRGRVYEVELYR